MTTAVPDFLARLALGPRQAHGQLQLWPLVPTRPGPLAPVYVSLAEALSAGRLVVEELADGAHVPQVALENRGDVAVLVLFGERIQGALQDRTMNASFLVPAGLRVVADVSCVEAGRWEGRRKFTGSRALIAHGIRRKMAKAVAHSRRQGPRFAADQAEVWNEIDERLARAETASPTRAYADYAESRRGDLATAARNFHARPGQVGFVATLGRAVVGLEAIGRPDAFAAVFPRLLESYLLEAIDAAPVLARAASGEAPAPVRFEAPGAFLAALAAAAAETGASLGGGTDVRLAGDGVSGCALVAGDVVHLTAFVE